MIHERILCISVPLVDSYGRGFVVCFRAPEYCVTIDSIYIIFGGSRLNPVTVYNLLFTVSLNLVLSACISRCQWCVCIFPCPCCQGWPNLDGLT